MQTRPQEVLKQLEEIVGGPGQYTTERDVETLKALALAEIARALGRIAQALDTR